MKDPVISGSHLHLSAFQVRNGHILVKLDKGKEKTRSTALTLMAKGGDKEFKTLNRGYLANIYTFLKVAIWENKSIPWICPIYYNLKCCMEARFSRTVGGRTIYKRGVLTLPPSW